MSSLSFHLLFELPQTQTWNRWPIPPNPTLINHSLFNWKGTEWKYSENTLFLVKFNFSVFSHKHIFWIPEFYFIWSNFYNSSIYCMARMDETLVETFKNTLIEESCTVCWRCRVKGKCEQRSVQARL